MLIGVFANLYFGLIIMVMFEKTHPIELMTEKQLKENEEEYNQVAVPGKE
jgi:hypothetical protein